MACIYQLVACIIAFLNIQAYEFQPQIILNVYHENSDILNYNSLKYTFKLLFDSSGNSTVTDHTTPQRAGNTIKVKKNETCGVFNNDAMTAEDIYSYPHTHNLRNQAIQNNACILEEVTITVTTNESCTYKDGFDSSNSIETKQNEAYAMSITTEKNEAYKPVSGACDEYDYIK